MGHISVLGQESKEKQEEWSTGRRDETPKSFSPVLQLLDWNYRGKKEKKKKEPKPND